MPKPVAPPATIDEYIAACDRSVRPILKELRRVIRGAAPRAEEVISYRMPAFKQNGVLIYFAAFKNHIGLFPPVSGDAKLEKAVGPYRGPKGNLKFPLDRPIPYPLIRSIVRHKVKQNLVKGAPKATKSGGTTRRVAER